MSKSAKIAIIFVSLLAVVLPLYFGVIPAGRAAWNRWFHAVQTADDATNYETLKKVEDTCRSMIASYNSDKLTYQQYAGSEDPVKREWAEEAKMRANKTASTYNTYILKNRYVWKSNIPADIYAELQYIE